MSSSINRSRFINCDIPNTMYDTVGIMATLSFQCLQTTYRNFITWAWGHQIAVYYSSICWLPCDICESIMTYSWMACCYANEGPFRDWYTWSCESWFNSSCPAVLAENRKLMSSLYCDWIITVKYTHKWYFVVFWYGKFYTHLLRLLNFIFYCFISIEIMKVFSNMCITMSSWF